MEKWNGGILNGGILDVPFPLRGRFQPVGLQAGCQHSNQDETHNFVILI